MMKKHIALAASLLLTAVLPAPLLAKDVQKGPIKIERPWSRATPGGAKVGGGFLKITNTGATPDRLVSAATDVSNVSEIHEMKMVDGVMKMRALGDGIALPPGKTVELKPGGYHLMFMDLKSGLKEGQSVKGTLTFEKAGKVDVEFRVGPIGGGAPKGGAGGGHSHH